MRGYFCDFVHVVCNWLKKTTIDSDAVEKTEIYPRIDAASDTRFQTLVDIVKSSPIAGITQNEVLCEFIIVAPLFLFLKAKYADGMEHKPDNKFVDEIKSLGLEGILALYLLGITLGYDKTYDALYESADFSFLKKSIECPQGDANCETGVPPNVEEGEPLYLPLPGYDDSPQPVPYMWVRRGNGKNAVILPAMTANEYEALVKEGYVRVKKFTRGVCEEIKKRGYNPKAEKKRLSGKILKSSQNENI